MMDIDLHVQALMLDHFDKREINEDLFEPENLDAMCGEVIATHAGALAVAELLGVDRADIVMEDADEGWMSDEPGDGLAEVVSSVIAALIHIGLLPLDHLAEWYRSLPHDDAGTVGP